MLAGCSFLVRGASGLPSSCAEGSLKDKGIWKIYRVPFSTVCWAELSSASSLGLQVRPGHQYRYASNPWSGALPASSAACQSCCRDALSIRGRVGEVVCLGAVVVYKAEQTARRGDDRNGGSKQPKPAYEAIGRAGGPAYKRAVLRQWKMQRLWVVCSLQRAQGMLTTVRHAGNVLGGAVFAVDSDARMRARAAR